VAEINPKKYRTRTEKNQPKNRDKNKTNHRKEAEHK
jgi:hypothetical protein